LACWQVSFLIIFSFFLVSLSCFLFFFAFPFPSFFFFFFVFETKDIGFSGRNTLSKWVMSNHDISKERLFVIASFVSCIPCVSSTHFFNPPNGWRLPIRMVDLACCSNKATLADAGDNATLKGGTTRTPERKHWCVIKLSHSVHFVEELIFFVFGTFSFLRMRETNGSCQLRHLKNACHYCAPLLLFNP
jgi:hypothetical protein